MRQMAFLPRKGLSQVVTRLWWGLDPELVFRCSDIVSQGSNLVVRRRANQTFHPTGLGSRSAGQRVRVRASTTKLPCNDVTMLFNDRNPRSSIYTARTYMPLLDCSFAAPPEPAQILENIDAFIDWSASSYDLFNAPSNHYSNRFVLRSPAWPTYRTTARTNAFGVLS
jgi:hypothetical protein